MSFVCGGNVGTNSCRILVPSGATSARYSPPPPATSFFFGGESRSVSLASAPATDAWLVDYNAALAAIAFMLLLGFADDVLDVAGDKALLGKNGSDRDNGKLTFPAVYGLEESRRRARAAADQAKRALVPFGRKAALFEALADFIVNRKK